MTISAISPFSASQTSNYQNYRQAFSQLANALQSGDLDAAKSAYDTVKSSPAAQGTGSFAQALQQIGNALDSNDSTARKRPSPRCSSNSGRTATIITITAAYPARTARI